MAIETKPDTTAAVPVPAVAAAATPQNGKPLFGRPQRGDLVVLRSRQGLHALCVVVGEDDEHPVIQFLNWQGKKLPQGERLQQLGGLFGDALALTDQAPGQWLEPRYRPLYFIVSGPLAERGRVIANDQRRLTEAWRDSSLQNGRSLLLETTWNAVVEYYLASGAFSDSLSLSRDLNNRRKRKRLAGEQ